MEAGFILHQYVFVEPLGEGGMAEVWKGRHTQLDYEIAIKFLKPQFAHDRDLQERFLNEGKRQANLDHPNIVRAIDFVSDGNRHFLIMKYVEGGGLDRRIDEAHGPLPLEECLNVSFQVLSALAHAHRQGVVHRDVKPSNVLINDEGHCYLTDFGIALAVGGQRLTRTGTVMGTDYYMSPEQIRSPHTVDHRTDIYAFGVVLFEMLTGVVPFDYDNEFLLKQAHVEQAPPKPTKLNPAISKAMESVVLRALEKKPEDRWSDCEAMITALEAAGNTSRPLFRKTPVPSNVSTHGASSAGRRSTPPVDEIREPDDWFARNRKALITLVAVILLAVVAGAGAWLYRGRTHSDVPATIVPPTPSGSGSSAHQEVPTPDAGSKPEATVHPPAEESKKAPKQPSRINKLPDAAVPVATPAKTKKVEEASEELPVEQPKPDRQRQEQKSELVGDWAETENWDGRLTTGDRSRYHATASRQFTITAAPDGYRGVFSERREIKKLDVADGFTDELTGTFSLQIDGAKVTGVASSPVQMLGSGSKLRLPAVLFEGKITAPGNLKYDIVWKRNASGVEIIGSHGTLSKR